MESGSARGPARDLCVFSLGKSPLSFSNIASHDSRAHTPLNRHYDWKNDLAFKVANKRNGRSAYRLVFGCFLLALTFLSSLFSFLFGYHSYSLSFWRLSRLEKQQKRFGQKRLAKNVSPVSPAWPAGSGGKPEKQLKLKQEIVSRCRERKFRDFCTLSNHCDRRLAAEWRALSMWPVHCVGTQCIIRILADWRVEDTEDRVTNRHWLIDTPAV